MFCRILSITIKPTVSASPLRAARSSGVRPCLSGWFRSAPASIRTCTAPFWPFMQAQLSAVSPSWSAEDREAPGTTNNKSIALQFIYIYTSNNLGSHCKRCLLSPFDSRSSTVLAWPSEAASISAERPCLSVASMSAPCFSSSSATWESENK